VTLFSVTEGEDKPQKYPLAFNTAHVALITKMDIAQAVGFDAQAAHASLEAVHPGMPTIELSARSGVGMDQWLALLEERVRAKQSARR
jgi:hydrogenase nickel incorporation protein HypB